MRTSNKKTYEIGGKHSNGNSIVQNMPIFCMSLIGINGFYREYIDALELYFTFSAVSKL